MFDKWRSQASWDQVMERVVDWLLGAVPAVILIVILALVVQRAARSLIRRLKPRMVKRIQEGRSMDLEEVEKRVETLFGILMSTLRIIVWLVAFMLILKNIGIDIAPILAGAGIAGLAVGFGAQELVRDVISGFFMLLENQVRTGDVAIVNGTAGAVESVGLRTLVLRDNTGTVHVFQNGKINSLSNMTKGWSAMVFDIGVSYGQDTDVVAEVMLAVAKELSDDPQFALLILEPMEVMGVDAFGDSSIIVKARLKTRPSHQWAVGREYRRRLKKAFDERGIDIPFPQRTVWVAGGGDAGTGGPKKLPV